MSWGHLHAVWASAEAKGTVLLVLLAYATAADDDGRSWLSVHTIARQCRIGCVRQARRYVHELIDRGELVVEGPHPDPRYRGAIVYRVARCSPWQQPRVPAPGVPAPGVPVPGVEIKNSPGKNEKLPGDGSHPTPLETDQETERERPQVLSAPDDEGRKAAMAERHGREATPNASTGAGRQEDSYFEGKAGAKSENPKPGTAEAGNQRIQDELRRLQVSCGNSDHAADWRARARLAGATTADEAIWVLRWMVTAARRAGEAVKYPSHVEAQQEPAREALRTHRAKKSA